MLELLLGLAREARDERAANDDLWTDLTPPLEPLQVLLAVRGTFHAANVGMGVLEGHVEYGSSRREPSSVISATRRRRAGTDTHSAGAPMRRGVGQVVERLAKLEHAGLDGRPSQKPVRYFRSTP